MPAAHAIHALAPAMVPVFVIDPAGHTLQSPSSFEPAVAAYLPTSQSVHALAFDAVEYLPTAHSVHVVAPIPVPVSVIDPAAHALHAATFDAIEYLPAVHAVHEIAPATVPLPVIEPAHAPFFQDMDDEMGWIHTSIERCDHILSGIRYNIGMSTNFRVRLA